MESEKFVQKSLISATAASSRILVIGMIFSIAFFLLLIDSFRTYSSEISVLISPKSQVALKGQAQIVNNLTELPKTLAFYDRLLKENLDTRDVTMGLSADQRKEKWNEMISIEKTNFDASVVKITITTSRQNDSIALVGKTGRTLFDTAAFYYNVKNDVDLRIIDGPITRVQVDHWYALLLLSVFAGFAISFSVNYLIFGNKKELNVTDGLTIKKIFDFKKKPEIPVEDELESLNNLYQHEQYDEQFQEIKKLTKELEPSKYPNFPEMPVRDKQSGAPGNLPIADDSSLVEYETLDETTEQQTEPVVQEKPEEDESQKKTKEPTAEELKRRLNQLLRGER